MPYIGFEKSAGTSCVCGPLRYLDDSLKITALEKYSKNLDPVFFILSLNVSKSSIFVNVIDDIY